MIRYFHPFVGGLEKKTLNLASALLKKGVHVEIITSRFSKKWPAREVIKGVPVCRLPSPRIKIVGALIYLLSLCFHIFKVRSQIEIIQAFQVGYSSAMAVFMGKILSKPTILNLSSSGKGGDVKRHKITPWGIVFLFFCRSASRIVVLNQEMQRELKTISYDTDSMVPITNGVDLNAFMNITDRKALRKKLGLDDEKIILYTGRLSREKGLDFLIHAYKKLPQTVPAKLFILGDGPEMPKLQKLIKHYHLGSQIKILSPVEEVQHFLRISDIFVMPSQFEGISNSILEAMACGLPVIANRVAGNTELIEDGITGLLIKLSDEDDLVRAFSYLLANPGKASELGQRAQEMVQKNYDLKKMVDKYIQLYAQL